MLLRSVVSAFLMTMGVAQAALASNISIETDDLGWYTSEGTHWAYNVNTLTGELAGFEYRSFYIWNVPEFSGTLTSARLDFAMSYSLGAWGSSQMGRMFDVSSSNLDFITLDNGAGHGVDIFSDLGSGTSYGDLLVPYDMYLEPAIFSVSLNQAALDAINASRGGTFAIGMKNLLASGDFLFSSGSVRGSQQLVLSVQPVPVPAAAWLFGSGLVGLAAAVRRRKSAR